jgi:hypothetical protein
VRYTQAELELPGTLFGNYARPPTNEDARHAQDVMPSLRSRSLEQIKSMAWSLNPLSKRKKK